MTENNKELKACHNKAPTGEIGELKITGKVLNNAFEKYKQKILDAGRIDTSFEYGFYAAIDFAKAHLQQAQKIGAAISNAIEQCEECHAHHIRVLLKQALNNKGF